MYVGKGRVEGSSCGEVGGGGMALGGKRGSRQGKGKVVPLSLVILSSSLSSTVSSAVAEKCVMPHIYK